MAYDPHKPTPLGRQDKLLVMHGYSIATAEALNAALREGGLQGKDTALAIVTKWRDFLSEHHAEIDPEWEPPNAT